MPPAGADGGGSSRVGDAGPVIDDVQPIQVAASFVLIAVTAVLGLVLDLGITRRLLMASARAAVQLLAVGLLFGFIAGASRAMVLAWLWVLVMVAITSIVARRRAPEIPNGAALAGVSVAVSVGVCLAVVFGLGVLAYEPVNLIVIAGITIGNAMPSQVLGATRLVEALRDERGRIEAMLSLGMSAGQVVRMAGGAIVRTALVTQIERTNVVGLIALPGAMTGLLLAGADPIDAVLIQIVVMYLVLGAVAISVVATVIGGLRRSLTPDLRVIAID